MATVNSILRGVVSALLTPLRSLPELAGLAVIALVAAVGMLMVYKLASNQEGLAAVKSKIHACLFEIRLFNDDIGAMLRAQWELLGHNMRYMRFALVPMSIMIVPFFLLIAQLQFHYGYHALKPGQPVIVQATLGEGWKAKVPTQDVDGTPKPVARLVAPAGVEVQTPTLWIPSQRQLAWRVAGDKPGDYRLSVKLGNQSFDKSFHVGPDKKHLALLSPLRVGQSFFDQLVYPAEAPLPAGPVHSISVAYPSADVWFFGWNTHWLVVFFILSIAFAFALRNRLGVKI